MKATQSTFWSLEITKTSNCFEVKNSTDLVESFRIFAGWNTRNRQPIPGRPSTVIELASATPPDGHD